ncbi:MAG: hypothetical protein KAS93_03450 [Gammaproteobacteria bacterium]|nr:hypothetical protein [Gammaproteobacteria bacterium]
MGKNTTVVEPDGFEFDPWLDLSVHEYASPTLDKDGRCLKLTLNVGPASEPIVGNRRAMQSPELQTPGSVRRDMYLHQLAGSCSHESELDFPPIMGTPADQRSRAGLSSRNGGTPESVETLIMSPPSEERRQYSGDAESGFCWSGGFFSPIGGAPFPSPRGTYGTGEVSLDSSPPAAAARFPGEVVFFGSPYPGGSEWGALDESLDGSFTTVSLETPAPVATPEQSRRLPDEGFDRWSPAEQPFFSHG